MNIKNNILNIKTNDISRFIRRNIVFIALIIVVIIFSFTAPNFLTWQNMLNIGRQTATILIVSAGMTLVIISANIDLAVGSTLAMAALMTALVVQWTNQIILGVLAGITIGAIVGLVNGILTTKVRIPSFLVTLGMMGLIRGSAMLITETRAVPFYNTLYWNLFGDGKVGIIPTSIIWAVLVVIVIHLLLRYSILGRKIYATGGNIKAAKYIGINTDRVIIWSFVICGILSAFAGIVLSSRMHAARPNMELGLELNVIAAVILGGTSFNGGRGSIIGTILGALVIGILNDGAILLGFNTHVQTVLRGIIIIAAVAFAVEEQ